MHYREQFQATSCFFFRGDCISRTKNALLGTISGDNLSFLEINAFLGRKLHCQGMISSDDLFFRDHFKSGTKIGVDYTQFDDLVLAYQLHESNCLSQRSPHATDQKVCHPCYKPIRTYEDNNYKQSNQRLASQTSTFSVQNLILANLIRFGDTRLKFLFKDFIKTKVNQSVSLKHKLLYKVLIRTLDKTCKKN